MTTRTQYFVAASLDGFIAETDDNFDWLTRYDGTDATGPEPGGYEHFMKGVGALVMGARTYDVMAGGLVETWPYGDLPAFVYANRERPLMDGAEDVTFVDGEVGERHAEMIDAAGDRHLWLVGGGALASQYVDAGLLDDLLLTIVPVWLGDGLPLFTGRHADPMELVDVHRFRSGLTNLQFDLRRATAL